jgi:hypothetical protein
LGSFPRSVGDLASKSTNLNSIGDLVVGGRINVEGLCGYRWWRLESVRDGGDRVVYECRIKPGRGMACVSSRRTTPSDAVRYALIAAAQASSG